MTAAAALAEHELAAEPTDFAWSQAAGPGALRGRAYSDDSTGTPVTCAGQTVVLTPYGRGLRGYGQDKGLNNGPPLLPRWAAPLQRRTICDATGRFAFEQIPQGTYEVMAELPFGWGGADRFLHRRVRIGTGATEVELRQVCRSSATETNCFLR